MVIETWKDIKGYEGIYQISDLGNVKSLYNNKHGLNNEFKIIKASIDGQGYAQCVLCKDKVQTKYKIHNLVALNFLNHKPKKGFVIDHINNISTDNRLCNLQIITHRENLSKDKKRTVSKYTGVYWKKQTKKWRSMIFVNGKSEHLGYFFNEQEAHNAYKKRLATI